MRSLRFLVVLLIVTQFSTGQARAQTSDSQPRSAGLSESLQGVAKDAFDSANLLFTNGDFAGALTKFQQAYDLSNDPRLLYQTAICEKNLHHYARMQALLSQYLRDGGSTVSAENRAAVEAALAAITSLVVPLTVDVSEPAATVTIDGAVVGTSPLAQAVIVDLGKHTVSAKKQGFDVVEQTIDSPGGSPTSVTLTLHATPRFAQLVIRSDEDSTVIVDGRVVGKGRFEGPLSPGAHDLRVTKPGKVAFESHVDLQDGETRVLQATLKDENRGTSIWPWLVGGAALAAGATVGGYFLFKSQPAAAAQPPGQLGSLQLMLAQ